MSTLKVIFDFILSVVKVIFPGKNNGRHCRTDHSLPDHHRPDLPGNERDGSSNGSGGSYPVHRQATSNASGSDTGSTGNTTNTTGISLSNKLMGQALIVTAIVSYLCKAFS